MGILSRLDLENNTNIYDREDPKQKTSRKNFKKYDKDYKDFRRKYKQPHPNIEPKSSRNKAEEDEIEIYL